MGRVTKPTYRVEYDTAGGMRLTPAAWNVRRTGPRPADGRPTPANLANHITALQSSLAPGGCNQQAGPLEITGARIVRQADSQIMAEWRSK